MPDSSAPRTANHPDSRDIGDLARAAEVRRQAAWDLSMSERLARVHQLCKQINAVGAHGYPRATADLDVVPDPDNRDLLGVPVRICSLRRLREMKRAQGRPQDQADLENLPDD